MGRGFLLSWRFPFVTQRQQKVIGFACLSFFQVMHGLTDWDSIMQEDVPDDVRRQQRSLIAELTDLNLCTRSNTNTYAHSENYKIIHFFNTVNHLCNYFCQVIGIWLNIWRTPKRLDTPANYYLSVLSHIWWFWFALFQERRKGWEPKGNQR